MKKIRLRKSRCIGENPVFPDVIYRLRIQIAWIFVTCLEQILRNADHSPVDTEYFQKNLKFKWLNFSSRICFASVVSILLVFVIHWHPPLHLLCLLITFLIVLFLVLLLSNSIRQDSTSEHRLNVYLISCINKDYWLMATVDATR